MTKNFKQSSLDPHLQELLRKTKLVVFDFDGVFTDNTVYVTEDGLETVRCYRGDGMGITEMRRAGIGTYILSTEDNPVVTTRARKLGIPCIQGCQDKRAAMEELVGQLGVPLTQVAYVGNDVNDRGCLRVVGLPIVVADAHPSVRKLARYRTEAHGGRGAVREVCDLFVRVRGREE